ncbi:MAG: hypothetical protein JNK84_12335 [Phreatobacter sp.]|uniref:hypothetical protein n=1 Tax=Phreatobacter sp. TaxID=1966341 RepID=UPI001A526A83|nr:hypothetical protein [Phreatobacter sp.]MBL8569854.1 hypothetical protein [Phreatobacter sp.]
MPKYQPFDVGVPIQASDSDLVGFQWETRGIRADFIIPHDEFHLLRISFDRQCIVRILDEMPLSTEDDVTPNEGLVSEHFAYRMEGALFARVQSELFKAGLGEKTHYRFITGWACLDVLTSASPSFSIIDRYD